MESRQAARGFAALALDTRLDLVRLLAQRGPAGLPAGDLAAALGLPPSTLSFHLNALAKAGLVDSSRNGRHVIYRVRFAGLQGLFGYLTETCCDGRPELCDGVPVSPAFNVLFLCTGNSGRSLMAQAILDAVGHGRFNAYSAGSHPADAPMPAVIETLRTLGHDTSRLYCKSWDRFAGPDAPRMDFVIALCDTLEGKRCPDFGTRALTASWPLPDPAKFGGNPAETATMIKALYGMVRRRLEIFVDLPHAALDRLALQQRLDGLGDSTHLAA